VGCLHASVSHERNPQHSAKLCEHLNLFIGCLLLDQLHTTIGQAR
jgi:hypothetical protein